MSLTDSRRIYRATTDSEQLDLPRAELTSGMQVVFVPLLVGMEALTGGGAKNLDGILTADLAVPTIFDVLGDDSMSRWVLRARRDGEDESTDPDDANKTKIIPDDDDTLIWVRINASASAPSTGGSFTSEFTSEFQH